MTGKIRKIRVANAGIACAAFFASVLAGTFNAAAKGPAAADTPRTGAVSLRVVLPDGSPATGAAVTVGRRLLSADAAGNVSVTSIPVGSGVVSGEIRRKEGGFLGMFRKDVLYAGFLPIEPREGAPLSATLTISPIIDPETSCRKCHPDKGGRSAMIKCAHRSGIPLKPAQASRVLQFNKENEGLRKSGSPGYPSIPLDTRKVGSGLFGGEKKPFLVCASCHSNHVETGQRAYVLMPFDEASVLCRGCHV
jgi:hypothetical protein